MGLSADVARIAEAARSHAGPGETVAAVLPAEPGGGERVYLCAFEGRDGTQAWLALDDTGSPVTSRKLIREATAIAALVEIAEETLEDEGRELRVASPERLDAVGVHAVSALQSALPVVEELANDVESNYKLQLT